MIIKNEVLNPMAINYAQGEETALTDMVQYLAPFIKRQADKAATKAQDHSLLIPAEDFESAFTLSIWQAAKEYDGTSHFMQRLRTYMGLREADVWRSYRTIKDKKATYEKAQLAYLDENINEEGDTLGDIVLSEYAVESPEDKQCKNDSLKAMLALIEDYKEINEKFYNIIKALSVGATNEQIANILGEEQYNGKVRSVVYRARNSFKVFLQDVTGVAIFF